MIKPNSKELKSCFETWNRQKQKGFVFISKKCKGEWKDYSFQWPSGKLEIEKLLSSLIIKEKTDLYWCPLIFSTNKRLEIHALPSNILYADLDFVKPEECTINPTIAWKSSENRYQAIWWLDKNIKPSELKEINKKLTYHVGADKGGWDITQVLRIPGTSNFKYEPSVVGKLLWLDRAAVYSKDEFTSLPDKTTDKSSLKSTTDFITLLSKYRKQLGNKTSRLLQYSDNKVTPGNRSEVLWSLESDMVKKQIPIEDIALLIQGSAWNKYKGRSDEWKRITTEITKIYESYQEDNPQPEEESEEPDEPEVPRWISFIDLMNSKASKPGWLIEDMWLQGSHGMVSGEPKTFKSTLAHDMAISIATGLPFLGRYPVMEQGPVLFIQNENSEWIMKDRSIKIMAHKGLLSGDKRKLDIPIYFQNVKGFNFDDPLALQDLENQIEEIRPLMVIMDPLYLMFSGDLNSAKDLNPVLQQLLEVKNKFNTSLLLVHHWNKSGTSSRGGQRMLGSTTLHGWNESALYLHNVEEDGLDENQAKIEIEREHRGAGILSKVELTIKMGNAGDLLYEPKIIEGKAQGSLFTQLLDLLSMYPTGLSLRNMASELKISRQALKTLMDRHPDKLKQVDDTGKITLR